MRNWVLSVSGWAVAGKSALLGACSLVPHLTAAGRVSHTVGSVDPHRQGAGSACGVLNAKASCNAAVAANAFGEK